mmetsp:Transcript_37001/g.92796  ORF Transcript_37001/g.92796 Transcript_37001/m.92796 type:complete len:286 (+) Transcript_37001:420-1277(+)
MLLWLEETIIVPERTLHVLIGFHLLETELEENFTVLTPNLHQSVQETLLRCDTHGSNVGCLEWNTGPVGPHDQISGHLGKWLHDGGRETVRLGQFERLDGFFGDHLAAGQQFGFGCRQTIDVLVCFEHLDEQRLRLIGHGLNLWLDDPSILVKIDGTSAHHLTPGNVHCGAAEQLLECRASNALLGNLCKHTRFGGSVLVNIQRLIRKLPLNTFLFFRAQNREILERLEGTDHPLIIGHAVLCSPDSRILHASHCCNIVSERHLKIVFSFLGAILFHKFLGFLRR